MINSSLSARHARLQVTTLVQTGLIAQTLETHAGSVEESTDLGTLSKSMR